MKYKLILASASPRRRQLLTLLGLAFEACSADVEEQPHDNEHPRDLVRRLSEEKARAVMGKVDHGLIIGADTIVALENEVLGKPANASEALRMLRRLRGKQHQVYTGISVLDLSDGSVASAVVTSVVWMRNYADEEMITYAYSGEPLDKAGGYAIQDNAFQPVAHIEGCYANVMGLPLCHLYQLLKAKMPIAAPPIAACDAFLARRCPVAATILATAN